MSTPTGIPMTIRLARPLEVGNTVSGPGDRLVLATSGCSIGRSAKPCRGCHARALWSGKQGYDVDILDLMIQVQGAIARTQQPLTVLGGEPTDQAWAVGSLLRFVADQPQAHPLIVYTGYTLPELLDRMLDAPLHGDQRVTLPWLHGMRMILKYADILKDGRYVPEEDGDDVSYRGSRNQRPILLSEMRAQGITTDQMLQMRRDGRPIPLLLDDWDAPVIEILDGGSIQLTPALRNEILPQGVISERRVCGVPQRRGPDAEL